MEGSGVVVRRVPETLPSEVQAKMGATVILSYPYLHIAGTGLRGCNYSRNPPFWEYMRAKAAVLGRHGKIVEQRSPGGEDR